MSASTTSPPHVQRRRGFGYWAVMVLAALLVVVGLILAAGGIWLIALGGSWYYAPAGIALAVAGVLLFRRSMAGVWLYLATFAATVVWALWEAGLDGWAQVPRLAGPLVLLVLVLLAIPVLRRPDGPRRQAMAPGAVGLALAAVAAGGLMADLRPGSVVAQEPAEPPAQAEDALPAVEAIEPSAPRPEDAPEQAADSGETMPMLETGADWPAYGGSYHATRYSPLDQITPQNVARLEQVWAYHTGDLPSPEANGEYAAETTPLKIGTDLFLCSAKNVMIALDAETGRERWRYDPVVSDDAIPYSASCRGVAYYEAPELAADALCKRRVMEGTLDGRLIAVDADLGQPCTDFGTNGEVDLTDGIGRTVPGFFSVTSPPTIVRGVAVMGHQVLDGQRIDAPSGVVRGYDAVTGELAWAWDMGRPGETGAPAEGETYTRGTPNMWTIASGDDDLGLVYLPMGNSAVDYYGATRSPIENTFSTALVAIDVTSGEVAWHFQTVHYDVWDYDLGSQGTLVDFPAGDGTVPAVVLSSKQGDIYVLDRETGAPLFEVEERPVPGGGVEPENLSPTQPFSTYHSLALEPLEESDMWGMSPIDQLWCRIQFRRASYDGMYTPPTLDRRFIQYPGYNGGSDWGGIAIDSERGIIVANYNDMPNFNRLLTREEADEMGMTAIDQATGPDGPQGDPQLGVPYAIDVNAGWRMPWTGLLCKQPPYGGIRAIELATGRTLWDRPLGTARKNGPFGIPSFLPFDIGTPNNGGAVLTASGLVFIAAATDDLIRAIDIETGETLWQAALPAGGQATPITYEADGRQYLAIFAGGHHFMETPIGDTLLAFALPE